MHIWEDSYIVEIIDPGTLEPVPDGEVGELVLTLLRREGMPILRYRTKDLTYIMPGECPCGMVHKRIARFVGRSDDMLIVSGVNCFPSQIEEVIMKHKWLGGNYLITLTKENFLDRMTIEVEVNRNEFSGNMDVLREQKAKLAAELRDTLGFRVILNLVEQGSLPALVGKAKRVVDKRDE